MEGEKSVLINFDFAPHGSLIRLSFGGNVFLHSDSNTTGKVAFVDFGPLVDRLSSTAAAVTRCEGLLPPDTYDTVLLPKGKTCEVGGTVTIEQNVILQEGAWVTNECNDFTVNGNLQGDGVNSVIMPGGAVSIHGNVSITGTTGAVSLDEVKISGNIHISDSNGMQIIVTNSQVGGNALFQNNTLTTSPSHGTST
jgi:hypothetical protein